MLLELPRNSWFDAHTHKPPEQGFGIQVLTEEGESPDHFHCRGLHPWNLNNWQNRLPALEKNLQHPQCLALGECGLDRRHQTDYSLQLQALEAQLELGKKLHLPLVLHCVRSHNDLLSAIRKSRLKTPFLLHAYSSSEEELKQWLSYPAYFGIGHFLLKRPKLQALIQRIPKDRILLETDEAPASSLEETGPLLARLLNLSEDDLKTQIWQNAQNCFQRIGNEF